MINVTKTYLPSLEKYQAYVEKIFSNGWVTNNGPLVQELEEKLEEYLGVKNLVLVTNGTLALQIAIKLLGFKDEVITTPFSFVATTSSLLWQDIQPVFVDIESKSLNLDASKIEKSITKKTTGILPVHVFSNACEVEKIDEIAKKNNLKVIYDASHTFNIRYNNKSLLKYGDISTISFHATKLFHTVEGGALIIKDDSLYKEAKQMRNFGFKQAQTYSLGINGKMSELHAAMGLCLLDEIDEVILKRKKIWDYYFEKLNTLFPLQVRHSQVDNNYHYFPIICKNENDVLKIMDELSKLEIFPRRYFYPSLDCLDFVNVQKNCAVSHEISKCILVLPLFVGLKQKDQDVIIQLLKRYV